jgi:CheY-like chemotaxis protein
VLKILIVEDEPLLAEIVRQLIELNPCFEVTGVADDLSTALAAVEGRRPDLALVDLQLANATSGYSVAAKLHDLDIACLFTSSRPPGFPLPDLALGCLEKPYREEDLIQALTEAEDAIRGRQKLVLRSRLPEQLELYSNAAMAVPPPAWLPPVRRRTSLAARLWRLVRHPSHFRSAAPAA